MISSLSRRLLAASSRPCAASALAVAQAPVRVRGTIEQVDGNTLSIKARDGTPLKLVLADNARRRRRSCSARSTISRKASSSGPPPPRNGDGTWKALEVHIFPESMRGTGEGHRPWEAPRSSMTNATVIDKVRGWTATP